MGRVCRRIQRWGVTALLGASGFLPSRRACAEDSPAAEALFKAGRDAARAGNTALACSRFRESYNLDPALGTKLNLALCEEELGNLTSAWQHFSALDRVLRGNDDRRPLVREHLAALDRRVPRLVVMAEGVLPPETRVVSEALSITPSGFGVPIPVDPGIRTFQVVIPGVSSTVHILTFTEGQSQVLRLAEPVRTTAPPPATETPATPMKSRPPERRSARTWGIITLGAGASALAVSAVTGLAAWEKKRDMDADCDASGCSSLGEDAARAGQPLAVASTVSFFVGLAALGSGAALLFLNRSQTRVEKSVSISVSPRQVTLRADF